MTTKLEKKVSLDEIQPLDEQMDNANSEQKQTDGMKIPVSELSPMEDESEQPQEEAQVPEQQEPEMSHEDLPQEDVGHKVYIAMDADDAGRLIGQAILQDDIESLQHTSHAINAGQNLILDWVEGLGGKVITAGGDEALVEVNLDSVDSLEELRSQYHQIVGATLTAGVGLSPSEAGKALLYGKVNGKDQVAVFDEQMEQELHRVHDNPEGEEEKKQNEHYLSGLYAVDQGDEQEENFENELMPEDHEFEGDNYEQQGDEMQNPHEDFEPVDHDTEGYKGEEPEMDFMDEEFGSPESLDELAPEDAAMVAEDAAQQEHADQDGEMEQAMKDELSQPESVLKQKLGELLQAYQTEKTELEQLQQSNPELYQEVVGLLQQMIRVAKMMTPEQGAEEVAPDQQADMQDPAVQEQMQQDPQMGKQ